MALSDLYYVTQDIDSYLVDPRSGLPLAGGQIYFYRDIARNVPKPIYQLTGAPPYSPTSYALLPNPLTLSAVGTVQNAGGDNEVIYYYPWITNPDDPDGPLILDLYYIVVTDSGGNPVLTREAWPNITPASTPIPGTNTDNFTTNQIANPQFTNVFTNPGIPNVYTVTGATLQVFEFAPNWFFQISGTGTVTVQIIPISGSQNVATNPPYVLDIAVSEGVTTCYLTQRFYNNSGLWTSTLNQPVYLYGSFVAQNIGTGTAGVQMLYVESTAGFTPIVIVPGTFTTPYMLVTGSTVLAIPNSSNTGTGFGAYVDIDLSFLPASHVQISSIQLIPTPVAPVDFILPDFDSSNRNEAYQGDYYIPRLNKKQIDSFLVGWDFALNPRQLGSSGSITSTPAYIMDQTIACAAPGTSTPWAVYGPTNGLNFPLVANPTFYLLQYLAAGQVFDMFDNSLSVNVSVILNNPATSSTMRVYLFSAPSSQTIPILTASIGTIAADGTFTLTAAGWNAVPRNGLPIPAQASVAAAVPFAPTNDIGFTGWTVGENAYLFAIVVTFQCTGTTSSLLLDSISVVPGDLPCRPAVKSFDETLRQCQYYFEMSYNPGTAFGTPTVAGALIAEQFGLLTLIAGTSYTAAVYPRLMAVIYKTVKRLQSPLILIYSTTGAVSGVNINLFYQGTSVNPPFPVDVNINRWTIVNIGIFGFFFQPAAYTTALSSGGAVLTPVLPVNVATEGTATFHYVIDARLGII